MLCGSVCSGGAAAAAVRQWIAAVAVLRQWIAAWRCCGSGGSVYSGGAAAVGAV